MTHLVFWSLTPYDALTVSYVVTSGKSSTMNISNTSGIRPSVNLKPEIKIVGGDGTAENPYRLMGENDSNLNGTKLNTRYSGEYINFGTGENNLYRIVSHETGGLTKITSVAPLKENSTFKTISFGDDVYYSNANMIGSFLNGEYLNSGNYLTSEQVNMIEDNTTWYLGTVGVGKSYKLAKYINNSMSEYTTNTKATVGLLRLGELMSGQFDVFENNSYYWTLTPYTSTNLRLVHSQGYAHSSYPPTTALGIKPSLNLKTNVIITSGDGTLQNPFEIELG